MNMNRRFSVVFPGLLLMAAVAVGAETVRIKGAAFAAQVPVAEQVLQRRGAGLLRYLGMVPVYAAAFYIEPEAGADAPLADVPKRLEVQYLVSAEARRFNEAGERHLADTLKDEDLASLRPRLAMIASWYPDPKPGDRCALTYVPGVGTELTFNGRVLGVVPGEDFQRAYFSIWLGRPAASDALRDALLGGD